MGLGNNPPPASTIAPASKAQPIGQLERAIIPTAREMERAANEALSTQKKGQYTYDEDNGDAKQSMYCLTAPSMILNLRTFFITVRRAPISNVQYLQAIPCFFVTK